MVTNARNIQDKKEDRLSMRHSLMVWVAGAVLGWVVAVVSVWTALNDTGSNIADNSISPAEQMEQIMPAAGNQEKKDN
ncbi:MAG: hypothetical protein L3J58_08745 [Emcibacter sp.]|nr:hypothetical protein [Emcibacter sp.]